MKVILSEYIYKGYSYLKEFSSIELEKDAGIYRVRIQFDEEKKQSYIRKYYGKKLTVTSHLDWDAIQILEQYCEQECIENDVFRDSKNHDHYAVRPQYHYTDDKILVHVFCCMLGLAMGEVLRKLLSDKGCSLTKVALLDELRKVRDGWIVLPGSKKAIRVIEDMDEPCERLWSLVCEVFGIPDSALRQTPTFRKKAKRHRTRKTKVEQMADPCEKRQTDTSEKMSA